MKHSDVEAYSKTTFDGFAISPDKDSWKVISDRLDALQHKKRKMIIAIRAAIFIAFLIHMPNNTIHSDSVRKPITSMANKPRTTIVESGISVTNKTDNGNEQATTNTMVTYHREKMGKEKNAVKPKKSTKRLPNTIKVKENKLWRETFLVGTENLNALNRETVAEVTNAEIDSLMEKAWQNRQRERALQEARATFTYEMLADIEKEIETKNRGFYQDIKRSYSKLKTAMAN